MVNMRELMTQMQSGMPSGPVQSVADTAAAVQKAPKKKHKNPASHLAKASKAFKAGNHAAAKTHALNFAKAVHQAQPAPAPAPVDPAAVPTAP